MELSPRQREVIESIVTIGRQDICLKQLAGMLNISYSQLIKHRKDAMRRNGYYSWEGFICDYVREEEEK